MMMSHWEAINLLAWDRPWVCLITLFVISRFVYTWDNYFMAGRSATGQSWCSCWHRGEYSLRWVGRRRDPWGSSSRRVRDQCTGRTCYSCSREEYKSGDSLFRSHLSLSHSWPLALSTSGREQSRRARRGRLKWSNWVISQTACQC